MAWLSDGLALDPLKLIARPKKVTVTGLSLVAFLIGSMYIYIYLRL